MININFYWHFTVAAFYWFDALITDRVFYENVNLNNGQNEIVFDRLSSTLFLLLIAAIGVKAIVVIGPHGLFSSMLTK